MAKNLGLLVDLLQSHPHDALGEIYMNLGWAIKSKVSFTPDSVSQLMANLQCPSIKDILKNKPFFSLLENACGAGGMVLPTAVKNVIEQGYNPAKTMWVQAIDIDRTAALMCYIQLSLWNVPAQVIVGNSLTLETNEVWFTPAYM